MTCVLHEGSRKVTRNADFIVFCSNDAHARRHAGRCVQTHAPHPDTRMHLPNCWQANKRIHTTHCCQVMQRAKVAKKKANKFMVSSKPADANSSTWYSPGAHQIDRPFESPIFFVLAWHARFVLCVCASLLSPELSVRTQRATYPSATCLAISYHQLF